MTQTSVPRQINFLYNPGFRRIKQQAVSVAILQAIYALQQDGAPHAGTTDTIHVIRKYLVDAFGFDIGKTESTRRLLYECLHDLAADRQWIERQIYHQRGEGTGRGASVEREVGLVEVYECTPKGVQVLEEIARNEDKAADEMYEEFCTLVFNAFPQTPPRGRARTQGPATEDTAGGEEELLDSVAWFEGLFSQGSRTGEPDRSTLKRTVFEYLNAICPLVVGRMLEPFRHRLEAAPHESLVDPGSYFNLDEEGLLEGNVGEATRKALQRVHDGIIMQDIGEARRLEEWLYSEACAALLEAVWPYDQEVRNWLRENLECIYIYPDTNVIIAALSEADPKHQASLRILEFLIDNNVRVLWDPITEHEFWSHLELTRDLVDMLEGLNARDIFGILDATRAPSLVRSYFLGGWRGWKNFEREVRDRYEGLKEKSVQSEKSLEDVPGLYQKIEELTSSLVSLIETNTRYKGSHSLRVAHDARALATVLALRRNSPEYLVEPECVEKSLPLASPFWFLSLDQTLLNLQKEIDLSGLNPSKHPLFLLFRTVFLYLEPHAIAVALAERNINLASRRLMRLNPRTVFQQVKSEVIEVGITQNDVSRYIEYYNQNMLEELEQMAQERLMRSGRS